MYSSTRFTRETHVAWNTMAKILRYTSIHVDVLDVLSMRRYLSKENDRRGRIEDTFISI